MSECPSCERGELILISGTYAHIFVVEKQYFICTHCGDKFEVKENKNVGKKI